MSIDYRKILLEHYAQLKVLATVKAEDEVYFEAGNGLKKELDSVLSVEDMEEVARIIKNDYDE